MAREIQITPKRIIFAQDVEMKLFKSLMKVTVEKQEEMTKIIQMTLESMKQNIEEVLDGFHYESK